MYPSFGLGLDKIFFKAAANHHQADRLSTSDTGCRRHRLDREFKFVERLCDDCYKLFRTEEVWSFCRSAKMSNVIQ